MGVLEFILLPTFGPVVVTYREYWSGSNKYTVGGFACLLFERQKMSNDGFIITYSGRKVYPLNMRAGKICLHDIAHALANKCRFGGYTKKFYSVAEHCILMAENDLPGPAVWRLFHDASEAYLPDLLSPIKSRFPDLIAAEHHIIELIRKQFKLPKLTSQVHKLIKQGDLAIRYWEGKHLMVNHPDAEWYSKKAIPEIVPQCWLPEEAEQRFIGKACELLAKNILDGEYSSEIDNNIDRTKPVPGGY